MAATTNPARALASHPIHAMLLASTVPLFLGAVLADWAYASTFEVQWTNFASWLIAGALVFAGLALAWALVAAFTRRGGGMRWVYAGLLAATFIVGFVDALVHAKDGWAAMPTGLILSVVVFVLAFAAAWVGLLRPGRGERA